MDSEERKGYSKREVRKGLAYLDALADSVKDVQPKSLLRFECEQPNCALDYPCDDCGYFNQCLRNPPGNRGRSD